MPPPLPSPALRLWMRPTDLLQVSVGIASRTGRREENEDFAGFHEGDEEERATYGVAAVLADGMGGTRGGRVAAELAVRSFMEAYYSLPATLGVAIAADRAIGGFNRWLQGISKADPAMAGAGCTFTALILRGREAHVLHAGDSRAWLFRDGALTQLSTDHSVASPERSHVLYRAIGLEPVVRLDHAVIALEAHDRLLLTSDGVHGVLTAGAIADLLGRRGPSARDAGAMADIAIAAGSEDNATALVVDVVSLPAPDHAGLAALAATLEVMPPPKVGESVDGFRLERQLSAGDQTYAFLARGGDGKPFVLKFPSLEKMDAPAARAAFVRERLIGMQAASPYLAEIVALAPEAQSRVYGVMPFYDGVTLEERLRDGPLEYAEGLAIAAKIARGVIALHRMGVIHRDIKPENILVERDGGVRLLDFGVARIPGLEDAGRDVPGSVGYLAPELYRGSRGSEATDQFALGVTLYRIFTNKFPFTDLQSLHRPGLDSAADPAALRDDMPPWLAHTLRKTVQLRPEDRFGDVTELLLVLEQGSAKGTPRSKDVPLMARNPVLLWQMVSLALLLVIVGLIAFK